METQNELPAASAGDTAESGGAVAAATLEAIERKIHSGRIPGREDWEQFQTNLLHMNMRIANSRQASPRVRADAVGKMLWAVQMNLERLHGERKQTVDYEKRDELDQKRTERRMDYEKAMEGHRWRTERKIGSSLANHFLPGNQPFAIPVPELEQIQPKWPAKPGEPPRPGDEYEEQAVPTWINSHDLGRPVEADDLPDEVYWYGLRPGRFGPRKKEPLFRVVKFRTTGAGELYRKTKRGNEEYPHLGTFDQRMHYKMLGENEISEYEAKVFGEQGKPRK